MNIRRLGGPLLFVPRLLAAIGRRMQTASATAIHRATLGRVGPRSMIQPGVRFGEPASVHIGSECLIWRGVVSSADGPAAPLVLEDRVQINPEVHLDHTGELRIGEGTLISEDAVLYTHDHGLDPYSVPAIWPKTVGREVWIGMRSIVLASCQFIGDRAVIGAGAIVTRDVPAGAVVAGAPARIVGWRDRTHEHGANLARADASTASAE